MCGYNPLEKSNLTRLCKRYNIEFDKCKTRLRASRLGILSADNSLKRYLLWRYPVNHIDGERQIPTCTYRFPDGQGDVGKFLEGIENSEKWERSNGSVYRIWSGMRPEM